MKNGGVWKWIAGLVSAVLVTNLGWTCTTQAQMADLCSRSEVVAAIESHNEHTHPGAVTRNEFGMLSEDVSQVRSDVQWIRNYLMSHGAALPP